MFVRKNGGAGNLQRRDDEWRPQHTSAVLTTYQQKLVEYLNFLDPIFRKSQERDEFTFLWTLLGVRRLEPVKAKPFETLKDTDKVFEEVNVAIETWNGANLHTGLFRYGLIIESDELYGFILNLLRGLNDEPPYAQPFAPTVTTDKKGRTIKNVLKPKDKITQIKNLAKKLDIDFHPFDDFYDNKLRNAVFHSSYHFDSYSGIVTVIGDSVVMSKSKAHKVKNPDTVYGSKELLDLLNSAFAFFGALMILRDAFLDVYEAGLEIDGTHGFIPHKFTTVAKEKVGLVGMIETAGPEPFEIPFEKKMRIGTFTSEDVDSLRDKTYILKLSPNEKAQIMIDRFPRKLQKYIGRYYKNKLNY